MTSNVKFDEAFRSVSYDVEGKPKSRPLKVSFMSRLRSIRPLGRQTLKRDSSVSRELNTDQSNNSEEIHRDELSDKICRRAIKQALLASTNLHTGKNDTITQIEFDKIETSIFLSFSKNERNQVFLWSAFFDKFHYMKLLYNLGVDISYAVGDYTALHLSAFCRNLEAVKWLLSLGCDINYIEETYTPLHCAVLGNSLSVVECLVKEGCHIHETVLNTAVLSNSADCVQYLLKCGAETDHYDEYGMTSLHIAADRGLYQVLKYLTEYSKDLNGKTSRQQTALHLAADGGYTTCVELLLEKGVNRNEVNDRGQTALHLAARGQSPECLEALLKGGCDANAEDRDKRTPLHSALNKDPYATQLTEILIKWGANVNAKDSSGYCPLHVAALNELSQCVDLLIMNGADLVSSTVGGMTPLNIIVRKTPTSIEAIKRKLNESLSHKDTREGNRDVKLKMDFRYLLQNSNLAETAFLQALVKEGCKEMLEHPLCRALLHLKWKKVRWALFLRLFLCSLFVLLLSLYVITSQQCFFPTITTSHNSSKSVVFEACPKYTNRSNLGRAIVKSVPSFMSISKIILTIFVIVDGLRMTLSVPSYLSAKRHSIKQSFLVQVIIFIVFLVSLLCFTGPDHEIEPHLGAFVVLCGWVTLMTQIGSLPYFGVYIAMFQKVQKEFIKLLSAYCCLLIGFSISFSIMFPDNDAFHNIFTGFVKVLAMMTGELDVNDLLFKSDASKSRSDVAFLMGSYLLFTLFLFFVTIILMNLLVGIAVHDIEGLHHTAGLSKLVRQTESIYYLEAALFQGYLPNKITNLLKPMLLISPKAYRVLIYVRPMNPLENQVPRDVMMEALKLARQRKLDREEAFNKSEENNKDEINKLNEEMREIKKMIEEILTNVRK